MIRKLLSACSLFLLAHPLAARAQTGAFDLAGPSLAVTITRGGTTLPIAEVPALASGDQLRVRAQLPKEQSARYVLVVAFLRGATNPPPKGWFHRLDTWKRRPAELAIVVPQGAQQAIMFMAPRTGGGFNALVSAVRGRPGAFVRAAQDLGQASLDRARLEAFSASIEKADSEQGGLEAVSPILAHSLRIKWNAECLQRHVSLRAACLTQSREALILHDGRGATLTETLTGAPTDIAFRVSATREGGSGAFSPYIGLVRDLVRLLGGFGTAQYQYIPAVAVRHGSELRLLLNTAPSFRKPQSVLVAALAPIETLGIPTLRPEVREIGFCAQQRDLVLPVDGSPLLFATRFARGMTLRLQAQNGKLVELPVHADASKGGLVVSGLSPGQELGRAGADAVLHGYWGFEPFVGPRFRLQSARAAWRLAPGAVLAAGRDTEVRLHQGAAACVEEITLQQDGGAAQRVDWTAQGAEVLALKLPLAGLKPGHLTLRIKHFGETSPAELRVKTFDEASRITALRIHAGDETGLLDGAGLDRVMEVRVDGARFAPGLLTRAGGTDQLSLSAADARSAPSWIPGEEKLAEVVLRDGRTMRVSFTVSDPRPRGTLIASHAEPGAASAVSLDLVGNAVPQDSRLAFSVRAQPGTRFAGSDAIEVATADEAAVVRITSASGLRLQDANVAVATFEPAKALGPSAYGPIKFRIVQGSVAGDWQPLATLVRLPRIDAISCSSAATDCVLTGSDLFLIASVSDNPDFNGAVVVPDGYPGTTLPLPPGARTELFFKLRDAAAVMARARLSG